MNKSLGPDFKQGPLADVMLMVSISAFQADRVGSNPSISSMKKVVTKKKAIDEEDAEKLFIAFESNALRILSKHTNHDIYTLADLFKMIEREFRMQMYVLYGIKFPVLTPEIDAKIVTELIDICNAFYEHHKDYIAAAYTEMTME